MSATPFHFGDRGRELYGVFHEPKRRPQPSAPAILLCNPFGEEAIRAYRLQKILAERISAAGYNVLRFDYFGAGESAGADADVTFTGMQTDIKTAHDELLDLSTARRVVWCGLGLGASAALTASRDLKVDRLILWDTVINGSEYWIELKKSHVEFLAAALDKPKQAVISKLQSHNTKDEAIGFLVSSLFQAEMAALDFIKETPARGINIALVGSRTNAHEKFLIALRENGADAHLISDFDDSWNSADALNAYIVPSQIIEKICSIIGDANRAVSSKGNVG